MDHNLDESYIIGLSYMLDKCPTHWQKFVKHVRSLWHNGLYSVDLKDILNRELIEYGAIYVEDSPDGPNLVFHRESDAIQFILKWT